MMTAITWGVKFHVACSIRWTSVTIRETSILILAYASGHGVSQKPLHSLQTRRQKASRPCELLCGPEVKN